MQYGSFFHLYKRLRRQQKGHRPDPQSRRSSLDPHADRLHSLDRLGGDVNFVVTGRPAGVLDDAHKEELVLALSTVVLMCRNEPNQLSDVQRLRLAIELAQDMRLARQQSLTEAAAFAKLRKAIDGAKASH